MKKSRTTPLVIVFFLLTPVALATEIFPAPPEWHGSAKEQEEPKEQRKPAGQEKQSSVKQACAVIEKAGGSAYILDSLRSDLTDAIPKTLVPCGGWISVDQGWVKLRHRGGFRVALGPGTFAEIIDPAHDPGNNVDHLTLYRGRIFALAETDDGELRVTTANGRVRLNNAAGLILFNQKAEETQVTSLENTVSFENRFEPSRVVKVHRGEASTMGLKALRVIPTVPRAVTVASIKPILTSMHIEEKVRKQAYQAAVKRQERKFAATVTSHEFLMGEEEPVEQGPSRGPASVNSYQRYESRGRGDAKVAEYVSSKIVGGEPPSDELLYPGAPRKRLLRKAKPMTGEAAEDRQWEAKKKQAELAEKRRLLRELARMRASDID